MDQFSPITTQRDPSRPTIRAVTTRTIKTSLPTHSPTPLPPPHVEEKRGEEKKDDIPQPLLPPISKPVESRLFSALDDHIEISGWSWNPTDAMRLDGQYWKDPETKTQKAVADETYYGPDYMFEWRLREFRKQQDLIYQFVVQLAFHTGQSTNMDQYWKGAAAGGRAIELIFPNVFIGKGARGPLDLGEEKAKKSLMGEFVDNIFKNLGDEQKKALFTTISDSALERAAKDEVRKSLADDGMAWAADLSNATTAGAAATLPTSSASPSASALSEEQRIAALKDPGYQLLKLLNSAKVSESQLKAWDLLYNEGKYFFPTKKDSGEIDWKDPVQRKRALEAYNDIVKMLSKGEGGLDWKNSPENSGLVFLTPTVKGAVLHATDKIRQICKKQWVTSVELMTHENVFCAFAELCALFIAKSQNKFPGRYLHADFGTVNERELGYAFKQFHFLTKNPNGYLCFSNTFSMSGETERRATVAAGKRYMERTGRYYSDRYAEAGISSGQGGGSSGGAFRIDKKPRIYDNPYHEKKERDRDELLSLM